MRVLVITSERPPVVSGVSRSVDQIVTGLMRRGHDVDVLAAVDFRRFIAGEVRISGVATRWARVAPRLSEYDVVNIHGPVPTLSEFMLMSIRALPAMFRPAIVYTHHSNIDIARMRTFSGIYNTVHERLAATADHVVVTSEDYRRQISARSQVPCSVVPWGVDVSRFHSARHRRTAPGRPLRIVFIGQMRPYKGVPELIAAVSDTPGLELRLVGAGASLDEYRDAARDASNITFLGRVSDDELLEVFAWADVVTLPSTTTAEAFGLVLIEGMASGCVPVASALPGVQEVAGPTGILVQPGDVAELRAAFQRLAADPALTADLQERSVRRSETYGLDAVAAGYEQILTEVVRRRRAARNESVLGRGWEHPETVLAQLLPNVDADAAAMVIVDSSPGGRDIDRWVVGDPGRVNTARSARHVSRSGASLVVAHTADARDRQWPVCDGSTELHIPVGRVAVLSLLRHANRSAWTYSDLAAVDDELLNLVSTST